MEKLNYREQKNPPTLRFLELDQAKTAVTASLRSVGSRRCYEHAISQFIDWYCSELRLGLNKVMTTRYRMHLEARGLAPGTVNLRLAAVRRLAYEAADSQFCQIASAAELYGMVRVRNWLAWTSAQVPSGS